MTSAKERLTIELEDVGGTSWWAGVLTTLGSQQGSNLQRFVGRVDGRTPYTSGTFSAVRPIGPGGPREEWAPGLVAALEELQRNLARDGWTRVGRGGEPWSSVYER